MIAISALTAYLIGSVPTAGFLARLRGIDLRHEGSGNPGTNNALRTGGLALAAAVLIVEAEKGYAAVWMALSIADAPGAAVGAVAAVMGNVFNVWYRFSGGKGLGISLGVLIAAFPWAVPFAVFVIVVTVLLTRSAGLASLAALAGLIIVAVTWSEQNWSSGGMVERGAHLIAVAVSLTAVMAWKHWRDSPLNPAWRPEQRTPA